jgi:6,7-dimethyl-8-ribityllumazine synthase
MVKTIQAKLTAEGKKFGIIVGRFNEFITNRLLEGCIDTLLRHGVKENDIEAVFVPGAFEIAFLARRMAESKKYDAVICLGTVIRGSTPHFDYVASEAAKGVAQVSFATGIPAIFGIITADSIDQAIERAGTKEGNKGRDAALSAIEMANLMKEI